jgi:signal transduction histidine kinase
VDRQIRVSVLIGSIGLTALAAVSAASDTAPALTATDLIVGLTLSLIGSLAWQRRPSSGVGSIVAVTGLLWLLGSVHTPALYLHRIGLTAMFLSFPSGKVASRSDQALLVASIALNTALPFVGPVDLATMGLALLVAAVVVRRALAATGPARRASTGAAVAAVAFALLLAAGSLARASSLAIDGLMLLAYELAVTVIVLGLLADLIWGRWSQAAVTGLVIDLGASGKTGSLRDRLALALGDRSLVVGYWMAGSASYVDEAGRPVELPKPGSVRRATPMLAGAECIGVLVHDEALVDDPGLIQSVAAAASLTVTNARLQVTVRNHMAQVDASRRRLVEAADSERRRIEEELDHGARGRLERIEHLLRAVGAATDPVLATTLATAEGELRAAMADLRELVRATHPPALRAGGLAAALTELASRMPGPVTVRAPSGRFAPIVETTLYFVCSEALANVAKHAGASSATVDLTASDGRLRLIVVDDGKGGADMNGGSGLRGLKDRLEALGGSFEVDSRGRSGTRLVAELPMDRSEAPAGFGPGAPVAATGVGVRSP